MQEITQLVDRLAAQHGGFSGVVGIQRGRDPGVELAYGLADRAHEIPMTARSQLAIASGSKGFTAVTVLSLVEEGVLGMSSTARSVLGDDLPLIGEDVTVEHLLSHRSGIGDYVDEETSGPIDDYLLPVPVQLLDRTEQFLAVLDGHPTRFPAGTQFAYCNSGFVILALIAERASGIEFHDLVRQRVWQPAEMADTEYLRSDALPGRAALNYLQQDGQWRTNVFHLPVRGNGDGGAYSTLADLHRFWTSLLAGRLVNPGTVAEMLRPRSDAEGGRKYGLGCWLQPDRDEVYLEGYDAGVSFRSTHDLVSSTTRTVIANTSAGAWPIVRALDAEL